MVMRQYLEIKRGSFLRKQSRIIDVRIRENILSMRMAVALLEYFHPEEAATKL